MVDRKFTRGQLPGVVIIVIFAFLSAIAVLSVVLRWAWLTIKPRFAKKSRASRSRERLFFQTQLGLYAVCLLGSNFCISLAGSMNMIWIAQNGVRSGRLCTAQAFLMESGNVALAYFTSAIAIHTFNSLVLRNRQRVWIGCVVISVGWVTAAAVGGMPLLLSHPLGPLYAPKALACGVARIYPKGQFLLEVLPEFIASLISVIVYSFIFLFLRGTLVFNGKSVGLRLDPNERWNGRVGTNEEYHRFIIQIARSMLWYPIVYFLLILPLSITHMLDISLLQISFEANVFAYSCWFLMGLANVVLLYNTFRVIGPAFDRVSTFWTRSPDDESFAASEEKVQDPPLIVEEFGPDDFPSTPSTVCSYPAMVHQPREPVSILIGPSSRRSIVHHQSAESIDSMRRLSELTEALAIPIPDPTYQQKPPQPSFSPISPPTTKANKPTKLPQSPLSFGRKPFLERSPALNPDRNSRLTRDYETSQWTPFSEGQRDRSSFPCPPWLSQWDP